MMKFDTISTGVFAVGRITPNGTQLCGTGFALNKEGLFATASHVAGENDQGLCLAFKVLPSINEYQDTSDTLVKCIPCKIHQVDPFHDLAILKADTTLCSNIRIGGTDQSLVGDNLSIFGFPHADHGRMVLTQQDTEIGAKILISASGIKSKHIVLNIQSRPGQSGSPVFNKSDGKLIGVIVGSYAPGGGGNISLAGVDPHTLHQTTHAVSAEYLLGMYES
ncbi:S1 family peptidase [Acetobacter senegalensis]|uniref:S1 family peptidase n=1 Tax=Acetobacter senegalensis TaxID=446692 RepID=UPI0018D3AA14|nr:serine protease [Acetobacter senegalensis]